MWGIRSMKGFSGKQMAEALKGRLIAGEGERSFNRISTDTRSILKGDLFIPLVGVKFDAHDFILQAVEKGAAGVVIARDIPIQEPIFTDKQTTIIRVDDTLKALQDLANYNRRQFNIPVIGVTGSNGKTTTKDMIGAVLETKYKTLKTKGNFNNQIGLPLTLLELDDTYQAVVVEMGMRGLGEIHELASIAEPDIGVITSIGETHLELLGSVENIARAKGEILQHVEEKGIAILNGDDPWIRNISTAFKGKVLYYGFNSDNHLQAQALRMSEKGITFEAHFSKIDNNIINSSKQPPIENNWEITVPVLGEHNVLNALAAIAIGLVAGVSKEQILQGLGGLKLTDMRLQVIEASGKTIINDAYNASPASVKAALKTLVELSNGRRTVAVLGNMFELGQRELEGHQEIGEAVVKEKVEILITVGDLAKNAASKAVAMGMNPEGIYSCINNEEAINSLKHILTQGDVVLVKGSRGMKMEEIVSALTKAEE
jgi:UDP-N-acetylmuramoyl-tripeptide--D-alanyl-D-alanine ligase